MDATPTIRDRYQTNDLGIRAVAEGVRIVKPPGRVRILGRYFHARFSDRLKRLVGQRVVVRVRNCYATEYGVHDPETWRYLFDIREV